MERCSRRTLDAMRGPRTAAFSKADMMGGMPVPCYIDWDVVTLRFLNPMVENRNHLIAAGHGECSARTEIILYVDDQKCVALPHIFILNRVTEADVILGRLLKKLGTGPSSERRV